MKPKTGLSELRSWFCGILYEKVKIEKDAPLQEL
jgi:hypothetical protein